MTYLVGSKSNRYFKSVNKYISQYQSISIDYVLPFLLKMHRSKHSYRGCVRIFYGF